MRKFLIVLVMVCLVCMLLLINTSPFARRKPDDMNVILLTVDSLRPDHLGCYGYEKATSPAIDKLAENGQVLRCAFSQSAWTIPGIMSILTSLQPPVHKVEKRGDMLAPSVKTIFDCFKDAGYTVPNICFLLTIPEFSTIRVDPPEEEYFSDSDQDGGELLRWLDKNHDTKFFIWYLYRGVHLPYKPSDESCSTFVPNMPNEAQLSSSIKSVLSDAAVVPVGTVEFESSDRSILRGLYDGEAKDFDSFVGLLVERLRRYELLDKTLIVITADHGEELMDHGFVGHASTMHSATMYDEIIRIPLIMSLPGYITGDSEIREQVQQIDIMPTILEIVGLPIPTGIQGRNLAPLLFGLRDQKESSIPVFAETIYGGYQATEEMAKTRLRCVRTDVWKLIETEGPEGKTFQLYDLLSDPKEFDNIYEENKQVASLHKTLLEEWQRENAVRRKSVMAEKTGISATGEHLVCPQFLFPYNEATLLFKEKGGMIHASWTGSPELSYVVEYDIGVGVHNLTGSFVAFGNRRDFGPYSQQIWNSLVVRNPWRVRVSPDIQPRCWSEWVQFRFE